MCPKDKQIEDHIYNASHHLQRPSSTPPDIHKYSYSTFETLLLNMQGLKVVLHFSIPLFLKAKLSGVNSLDVGGLGHLPRLQAS